MTVERLKKHCPLPEPFIIEEIEKDSHLGYCSLSPNGFKIQINTDTDEGNQIETLIHEWAHALRLSNLLMPYMMVYLVLNMRVIIVLHILIQMKRMI